MNARDQQGPGGLLMLFASSATLWHLAQLFPRLGGFEERGRLAGGLFAAAVVFLVLGLSRRPWARNVLAFLLAAAVLEVVAAIHFTRLDPTFRSRELEADAAAARVARRGENPYLRGVKVLSTDRSTMYASGRAVDLWKPPYTRPAGAFLAQMPLAELDPKQRVDPRWVLLQLGVLTALVLGAALGRNFFFLPMLMLFAVPAFLQETVAGNPAFAWVFLAVLAWVTAPHRVVSGALMGLACATNAAAWFVAPFLAGITGREAGWRMGLVQLLLVVVIFAGVNAPWLALGPEGYVQTAAAWGDALSRDLVEPAQGQSIGLVYLEREKLVPRLSDRPGPYWLLVGVTLAFLLALYLLFPIQLYALGPVLGVLPFWAFWNSDLATFVFVPVLALAGWAGARIHPPELRFREGRSPLAIKQRPT